MENFNEKDDSSAYLLHEGDNATLDFASLFSPQFANIVPLYSSPSGATELFSATRYGKRFILKGLKKEYRDDPIHSIALAKEFEIGMLLDHPNIRRTVGFESVEGYGNMLVLEYVDGRSLESLIHSRTLTLQSARSIARQIASALEYIHRKQVFHRDLKPSNILVSTNGDMVKLIDFNLSDSDTFIVLKNPAGTRKYIAPEQLEPGARPSVAADIYSFGILLDEIAETVSDGQLSQAAAQCINPDPEKRPQSISMIEIPTPQLSLSNILSSKTLTYLLVCICTVLAAYVIYLILR